MEDNRNTAPDIFDRMMGSGFLKRFEPFYKAHKEILLYLLFGGLTTLVGIIFFAIPVKLISLPEVQLFGHKINLTVQVANVISWVCAVTFAVSSVQAAKLYYEEFLKQMTANPEKSLKIAIIYSYGANEEDPDGILDEENPEDTSALDSTSRDFLEKAISDYNKQFNTNYDTSSDKFQS